MDMHKIALPLACAASRLRLPSTAPCHSVFPWLPLVAVLLGASGAGAADATKDDDPSQPVQIRVRPEPASTETLRQWTTNILLGDYERAARHDPIWDTPAREALSLLPDLTLHKTNATPVRLSKVAASLQAALDADCPDPLLRFLHLKWTKAADALSDTEHANRLCAISRDMDGRDYSTINKFYASLRAVEKLDEAFHATKDTNLWDQAWYQHQKTIKYFRRLLRDPALPSQPVITAGGEFLHCSAIWQTTLGDNYRLLFQPYFDHWPTNAQVRRQEGWFFVTYAWAARGGLPYSEVSPENRKLFRERLPKAKAAYLKAWQLEPENPQAPTRMLDVMLGLASDREEMETWFQRAMNADPNNYDACAKKLLFLDSRWYGSPDDMLAFGRECVASPKWGGEVPLILAEAHNAIQLFFNRQEPGRTEYYLRPSVWRDIKASFERFYQLNPGSPIRHDDYAILSYRCQQWDELNRQLRLLGGKTNFANFGGQPAFNKIVQAAQAHAAKPQ